jgi:hypothetical protein
VRSITSHQEQPACAAACWQRGTTTARWHPYPGRATAPVRAYKGTRERNLIISDYGSYNPAMGHFLPALDVPPPRSCFPVQEEAPVTRAPAEKFPVCRNRPFGCGAELVRERRSAAETSQFALFKMVLV